MTNTVLCEKLGRHSCRFPWRKKATSAGLKRLRRSCHPLAYSLHSARRYCAFKACKAHEFGMSVLSTFFSVFSHSPLPIRLIENPWLVFHKTFGPRGVSISCFRRVLLLISFLSFCEFLVEMPPKKTHPQEPNDKNQCKIKSLLWPVPTEGTNTPNSSFETTWLWVSPVVRLCWCWSK